MDSMDSVTSVDSTNFHGLCCGKNAKKAPKIAIYTVPHPIPSNRGTVAYVSALRWTQTLFTSPRPNMTMTRNVPP